MNNVVLGLGRLSMSSSCKISSIVFSVALLAAPSLGAQSIDFSSLFGYIVIGTETVDGTFEGCSHGRTVGFDRGGSVECAEYGYQYAYRPSAAILVTTVDTGSSVAILCKLAVGADIYSVQCNNYVQDHIRGLRAFQSRATDEQKAYIDRLLAIYEAMGIPY